MLGEARGLISDEGRLYRELTHASELRGRARPWHRAALLRLTSTTTQVRAPVTSDLTDEQWAAVRGAFGARISVLTGGPGVGKTVCTRAIVDEAEAADLRIALCAPTGRAARRLEEATGHAAQTIHRMLEWMPGPRAGLQARTSAAGRPGDRRRVLDAQPAPDRGAARRPGGVDPHRLRRRRRPTAADRRRQALRGPDRGGDRPRGPPYPDLPPGGALDDHHRRPRDQPGSAAAPRAGRGPGPRLLLHRADQSRAGAGDRRRGGRRASAEALRCRSDPRGPGAGPDVPRGDRDRRPQRAPAGRAKPRRQACRSATASGSATG